MAQTHKVLGQIDCAATTLETLYTVPALTQSIVSSLVVCNRGVSTTFRIAVRTAGASIDNKHYLVYDAYVEQFSMIPLTLGITLATTDVISVYAGHTDVSMSVFGVEIT